MVIGLVMTPDGPPLAYEVLAGNTSDNKTLRSFLAKIEMQYGKARRIWVMDRGIRTEEVLGEMRQRDPPVQYLVGTPKGRLTRLEKHLIDKPWQEVREGVQVKLLAEDDELLRLRPCAKPAPRRNGRSCCAISTACNRCASIALSSNSPLKVVPNEMQDFGSVHVRSSLSLRRSEERQTHDKRML